MKIGRLIYALPLAWTTLAVGSVVLTPTADTMVSARQPDGSFGAAGALAVSAASLANGEYQSLLKFSAASARSAFDAEYPAGWTLSAATLALTAAAPNNQNFNSPNRAGSFLVTWTANDAWAEGSGNPTNPGSNGITFNTLPSVEGLADRPLGTHAFPGGTAGQTAYALILDPSFVADVVAGGDVTLRLSAADPAVTFVFNSSNFPTPSAWPTLTLTAVPIPEPALLASFLLLPLARRPRRTAGVAPV